MKEEARTPDSCCNPKLTTFQREYARTLRIQKLIALELFHPPYPFENLYDSSRTHEDYFD